MKKHLIQIILMVIAINIICYFTMGYLSFDCSDYAKLTTEQALKCTKQRDLGIATWLSSAFFLCNAGVVLYGAFYGLKRVLRVHKLTHNQTN